MPNIIKKFSTKKLLDRIENSVQSNKTYTRISKEIGLDKRYLGKILKDNGRMTVEDFREEREKRIALMILDERRPIDIAKKIGISRQQLNNIKNNIIWDKYEKYNKLGLEL